MRTAEGFTQQMQLILHSQGKHSNWEQCEEPSRTLLVTFLSTEDGMARRKNHATNH